VVPFGENAISVACGGLGSQAVTTEVAPTVEHRPSHDPSRSCLDLQSFKPRMVAVVLAWRLHLRPFDGPWRVPIRSDPGSVRVGTVPLMTFHSPSRIDGPISVRSPASQPRQAGRRTPSHEVCSPFSAHGAESLLPGDRLDRERSHGGTIARSLTEVSALPASGPDPPWSLPARQPTNRTS
jgi:hypothetical protein